MRNPKFEVIAYNSDLMYGPTSEDIEKKLDRARNVIYFDYEINNQNYIVSINEYDTSPIISNDNIDPNAKHLAKTNSNEFLNTRYSIDSYLPKSINTINNSRIKSL